MFRITLFLFLALSLLGCKIEMNGHKNGEDADTTAIVKVPVEIESMQLGGVYEALHLNQVISTEAQIEVFALVSGQVDRIYVEEGDRVQKGDTLLKLEDAEIRLREAQAFLDFEKAQADLDRYEKLSTGKGLSQSELADARYRAKAAELTWMSADLGLKRSVILAPVSGLVSKRHCQLAARISTQAPLFDLLDDADLIAVLDVPERELNRLHKGQLVRAKVQAAEGEIFEGQIRRIAPVVDTASGTARVTVALSDPKSMLRVGMYARFEVITEVHEEALLLSKRALQYEGDLLSVWVQRTDSLCERLPIEVGFKNELNVEVLAGLQSDDQVIVVGQTGLRSDSQIQVIKYNGVSQVHPDVVRP
jgi:membrane fusion protein, multidrug efflux system